MRAVARQRAGHRVEWRKSATDAGLVFQGVKSAVDRERQPAVLEAVAKLHAFGIDRAEIAKGGILPDAAQAQAHAHAATLAADEPAARKIIAHVGNAAATGVTAVKARKVAVGGRALASRRIVTEAEGPAWCPICQRGGLGVDRWRAQRKRSHNQCETSLTEENGHPLDRQVR